MDNANLQSILDLINNQIMNQSQNQDLVDQEEVNIQENINNNNNNTQMIVEEFKKDWDEKIETETPNLYQLQRRQVNLRGTYKPMKCPGYGFICAVASYKNRYIFLGTSQNQFFCYDLQKNQLIFEDYKHSDWVLSIEIITIQGVDIVISGGGLYDRSLCFYDLSLIDQGIVGFISQQIVHNKSITKIYYIEDKNLLITCGSDFYFKIWKISIQKQQINQFEEEQSIRNEGEIKDSEEEITDPQAQTIDKNFGNFCEYYSDDESEYVEELSNLKVSLKLIQSIGETSQVYSFCESDDNFMSYGTGQGFLKVLKFSPNLNKAKQVRSFKFQRSIWCLQRFINFKYLVGYSFQTQGRVDIINIVTGQHIMKFFNFSYSIHSFKIITKLEEKNIVIKNKQDFIKKSQNSIALVGASKLGQVQIVNIGDRIDTPIEYKYQYNQNIEWIPWNPLTFFKCKNEDDYPEFEKYKIYCSTGNSENKITQLIPLIEIEWYV
ncbi:hypothetical protein TTHERM_00486100 (macronuclear) [Tetrahymena thermophila SB210]|uniref:Uncharacterized protein n=1 Tax=Tetrahymena thermophila (strain SB210) TaxID=312017 RepID=I7MCY6_TETTS|nr:hypothetical protein TTHERM_00486100 [Tetrahymena thermophila SB210]EAR85159.1 hypothetical protein TTHERM_00486100 [Tetrahymena thermophila SB210]|eukprot:XP_001032822.1 hypothetical protein TTHERM_00486100 [Tetrahymena thermophila SB210]